MFRRIMAPIVPAPYIYDQASFIHLVDLNCVSRFELWICELIRKPPYGSPPLSPELIHGIIDRESDEIPNTANRILS
jgi:hypothetical protein